ncbi:MAG: tetratricopeptide repeat protein [Actinomycetota bacterium]
MAEVVASLSPYLPRLALQWVSDDDASLSRDVEGTVVFVDISGFTNLSEKLAKVGREGAEALAEAIGSTFGRLLAVAYGEGGGLIKFGGDALFLLFTGPEHPVRGVRAAHGMRRTLREIGRLETKGGKVNLRMSVGVHSGTFNLFLVGGSHRELMITGPAATQVVKMEGTAVAGEILLSPATAAHLPARCLGLPKGPGVLLKAAPAGVDASPDQPVPSIDPEVLARCIPLATREHLRSGFGEPEHRQVTVAFLHFDHTDAMIEHEGSAAFARHLDALVRDVQAAVDEQDLCFLSTDVDHDGGKIILTGGAPRTTGDDEDRMLIAVHLIMEGERKIPIRIGVNRGPVFAGDIGPAYRRTYTIMGDAVNLAARVMAKAEPGQALATEDVLAHAHVRFETTPLEPFMVKGKSRPIHASVIGALEAPRIIPGEAENDRLPLVGRDAEMAEIDGVLEEAREGGGRFVEIIGEAGIGKSRLLEEIRRAASGFSIWTMACELYGSSTPYFPFRRPMREALGLDGLEDREAAERLRERVHEIAPELEPWLPLFAVPLDVEVAQTEQTLALEDEFRKTRLERSMGRLMQALTPTTALLTIEDAHWMDEASADLLRYLVTGIRGLPAVIVVTRRDVGTGFAASERDDAVSLRPAPLAPPEAARLAGAASEETPLSPHELEALAERSGGNPLFLKELVGAAVAAGGLEGLPDSVEAVITAQIDHLPPRERTLLRYASVLGQSFSEDLALGVLSQALPDLGADAFASLSGFVVQDRPGERRFAHALLRDAAYEGLPFGRRRALHALVGETIERSEPEPEDEAELLSMHFFHSDAMEKAWRYSRIAGERARSIYANVEAAGFYQRAIEAARQVEVPRAEVAQTYEALGDVEERLGLFARAKAAFRAARRLVADDPLSEARLCLKEATIQEAAGRYGDAVRWIRRGEQALAGVSTVEANRQRAQLSVWEGVMRQVQGRHREAVRCCERAIGQAEESGDQDALAHAYYMLDWAYMDLGRPEKAIYSERALAIYQGLNDLPGQAVVYNNLGAFAYYQGRWAEALEYYEKGREARGRTGDAVSAAMGTSNIGEILSDQGRLEEAEPLFRAALRVWSAAGFRAGVADATIHLGRVASRSERFDEALTLFEWAREEYLAVGAHALVLETDARIAECHLFQGNSDLVLKLVDDALHRAMTPGGEGPQIATLHRLAGYAQMQLRNLAQARVELERSLEVGRARQADFEVALTLRALVYLARLAGDDGPEVHTLGSECRSIFDRLGVVARPRIPLVTEGDAP